MKVSLTLEPEQRLILQLLGHARELPFRVLERLLVVCEDGTPHLADLIEALSAWTEPVSLVGSWREPTKSLLEQTIEGLEFVGLVKTRRQGTPAPGFPLNRAERLAHLHVLLTADGERVASVLKNKRRLILRAAPEDRRTIFVASAFGQGDVDDLFDVVFRRAISSFRYEPIRVDISEPATTITDAVQSGISECACVIADLTMARPSVYFEIGLAHGMGVPILLTCRSDHYRGKHDSARVHFDLEQFKIGFWSRSSNGRFTWKPKMSPSARLAELVPAR